MAAHRRRRLVMRRFVAGFLLGILFGAALIPVGVLIGAALIGLGLGTLWAKRRRASTILHRRDAAADGRR